jgi:hypothetical protein
MMHNEQENIDFLKDPSKWVYNYVPVIKSPEACKDLESGIFTQEKEGPRVYLCSMYDMVPAYPGAKILMKMPENVKVIEYADVEGVVRDGWRVD